MIPVIAITFDSHWRPFVGEFLPLVGRTLARLTAEAYSVRGCRLGEEAIYAARREAVYREQGR